MGMGQSVAANSCCCADEDRTVTTVAVIDHDESDKTTSGNARGNVLKVVPVLAVAPQEMTPISANEDEVVPVLAAAPEEVVPVSANEDEEKEAQKAPSTSAFPEIERHDADLMAKMQAEETRQRMLAEKKAADELLEHRIKSLFGRFCDLIPHKGHRNLLIRGLCAGAHALLSFILAVAGENRPHTLINGLCQFAACLTLVVQFRTANPYMFIARGICSWLRIIIIMHNAVCGRTWPGETCTTEAWSDVRMPFRIIACFAALRMFLNGLSLILQYKFPRRGVGQHGNEQLFMRGYVQASGIPLHYITAMLKLGELSDTKYNTATIEIAVHFLRAFIVVPIASWSLFDQWVNSGAGKKTDDIRTTNQGAAHLNAADKLTAKLSPHKGHRNLLIRCLVSLCSSTVTFWLIIYDIGPFARIFYMLAQLIGCGSLGVQWRTGNPKMFLVRGAGNWMATIMAAYATKCGTEWPGEGCKDQAWDGDKKSLRIIAACSTVRLFCNGLSLFCQYRFPHTMFAGHGNIQLFIRGCVQATGVPLHVASFFLKTLEFNGTTFPLDYTANFLFGVLLVPLSSWSLFHQWKHTSAGNTGHPASDAFERDSNPSLENDQERLKVTLISARGLRNADLGGKSDPYAVCNVLGRPGSTFQTKVVENCLDPVWEESQVLPLYRSHDSLEFIVRDYDAVATTPCCKFFDDGDDLLGSVILKAEDVHPNGFQGDVPLTHCGRHGHAVIKIKIEILGVVEPEPENSLGQEAEIAVETIVEEVKEAVEDAEVVVQNELEAAEKEVQKDLAKIGIKLP